MNDYYRRGQPIPGQIKIEGATLAAETCGDANCSSPATGQPWAQKGAPGSMPGPAADSAGIAKPAQAKEGKAAAANASEAMVSGGCPPLKVVRCYFLVGIVGRSQSCTRSLVQTKADEVIRKGRRQA